MNEVELKDLFVSSIESRHIFSSKNRDLSFLKPGSKIRVKNEGYFGQFDLVIAVIEKTKNSKTCCDSKRTEAYYDILMRTGQLTEVARTEKCRIDCISLYPVELKSNCDVLDGRLPNQIMNAILTFGRSIVVLDKKHVIKNSIKFLRLLPATIIGYTGMKDHFEVLSSYDRIINTGMFNLSKRRFAKTLIDNGIVEGIDKIYKRLHTLEHINQKIVFNELYDSNPGFLKEEIEFLGEFSKLQAAMTYRKQIEACILESKDNKITNYF
ncbi:MAG TPA: hypothetical protein VJS91_07215 [Nitrososphaeraceae archaeon]|nr:hypothetical protein [Nitrososphaeraceae archaeon]